MNGSWTKADDTMAGHEELADWVDGKVTNGKITLKHIKNKWATW